MRLRNDSYIFITELRKVLAQQAQMWQQSLRDHDVIAPNLPGVYRTFSKTHSWKEFLRLAMVFWYLEEPFRTEIRLFLEDRKNKYGTLKAIAAQAILNSEPEMVLYITESSFLFQNERALFGFLKQPFDYSRYSLQWNKPRKAKRPKRKRGYDDHGSRTPDHKWKPTEDYTLNEEQHRIEEQRQTIIDTCQIIQGGLP